MKKKYSNMQNFYGISTYINRDELLKKTILIGNPW